MDDHPLILRGVTDVLRTQSDMHVCGEARSAAEAIRLFMTHSPDLAIVDLFLLEGSGLELIKDLKYRSSTVKVLILSVFDEHLFAERALRAGASGYVTKRRDSDVLLRAIRTVMAGDFFFSPDVMSALIGRELGSGPRPSSSRLAGLTDREVEVFGLLGQGLSVQQIAENLSLSRKTIDSYRDSLRVKLGVTNTSELVYRAVVWTLDQAQSHPETDYKASPNALAGGPA